MANKQLMFGEEAGVELRRGLDQLARAVKVTMGPTGRNVVMEQSSGAPTISKDGVSVAKEIEVKEPFQNLGAKMVTEVARNTADNAGDGTTTATVLADAIYDEGLKHVTAGANAMALQRGIVNAAEAAAEAIRALATECSGKEDLRKVATVSANSTRRSAS